MVNVLLRYVSASTSTASLHSVIHIFLGSYLVICGRRTTGYNSRARGKSQITSKLTTRQFQIGKVSLTSGHTVNLRFQISDISLNVSDLRLDFLVYCVNLVFQRNVSGFSGKDFLFNSVDKVIVSGNSGLNFRIQGGLNLGFSGSGTGNLCL